MKKIIVLLFGLMLVLAPSTAMASSRQIKPLPAISSDTGYGCQTPPQQTWIGRAPRTSANEQALVAKIRPSQNLAACDLQFGGWLFGNEAGAAAWIALVPGYGNAYDGQISAIAQIGVIDDRWCSLTSCSHNYTYFMATGGCNGATPNGQFFDNTIKGHNFGSPVGTLHKYRMDITSGRLTFYMDDYQVFNSDTDGQWDRISCWALGTKDFMISGEKSDSGSRYSGTGAGDVTHFEYMRRKYQNTWYDLSGNDCENTGSHIDHPDGCAANGTTMNIWTN